MYVCVCIYIYIYLSWTSDLTGVRMLFCHVCCVRVVPLSGLLELSVLGLAGNAWLTFWQTGTMVVWWFWCCLGWIDDALGFGYLWVVCRQTVGQRPVTLVGHSMGRVLSLTCARLCDPCVRSGAIRSFRAKSTRRANHLRHLGCGWYLDMLGWYFRVLPVSSA